MQGGTWRIAVTITLLLAGCGGSTNLETTSGAASSTLAAPSTTSSTAATTTAPVSTTAPPPGTIPPTTAATTTTTSTTIPPEPAGVSWEPVPHDEAVLGGNGAQGMQSVVSGGPGLVAVGYAGTDGSTEAQDLDAAVWVSPDGTDWERVPHDETVFGGQYPEVMNQVIAGGPGLIAVGYDAVHPAGAPPTTQRREYQAAVWVSVDGYTWSRIGHAPAVFGGADPAIMLAVTAGGPGFVAVGYRGFTGAQSAAVWTSSDGLAWSPVPHSEPVLGGTGEQRMRAVAAGPGGRLVAVGTSQDQSGTVIAAAWISDDGRTWSRVPHDPALFGGGGAQDMNAVIAAGPGFVAGGSRWTNDRPGDRFAVIWTSPDGEHWSQVPTDEEVFGGKGPQVIFGFATIGPEVFAVGQDSAFTGGTHIWASPDGLVWSRVMIPESVRPTSPDGQAIYVPDGGKQWYDLEILYAAAAGGPGLAAVGTTLANPTFGTSAAVIYSPG